MANYTPPASFSTSHATTTSIPQAPSSSALPPDVISPSTLDTLPILASILSRLQTGGPSSTTAAALPLTLTQTGSPHVSQSQSLTLQAASTSSPFAASGSATNAKDLQTGPLTTKDIPAATDELKSGLKKARLLVAQLPDMDRGVEEQEAEIRELEARIEEQRKVLEGLKAVGDGDGMET